MAHYATCILNKAIYSILDLLQNAGRLVDSFKTEKRWRHSYRSITNSYVPSLGENKYFVDAVYTNALRITIYNLDNQALNLKYIKTKLLNYILFYTFLDTSNQYFMPYENAELRSPSYDIKNFKKNISTELDKLDLGKQISLLQEDMAEESIVAKWWLWAIIILIIALLGYSTLGMLKKAE